MKKRLLLTAVLLLCVAMVAGALVAGRVAVTDADVVTSMTNLAGASSTATNGQKLRVTIFR